MRLPDRIKTKQSRWEAVPAQRPAETSVGRGGAAGGRGRGARLGHYRNVFSQRSPSSSSSRSSSRSPSPASHGRHRDRASQRHRRRSVRQKGSLTPPGVGRCESPWHPAPAASRPAVIPDPSRTVACPVTFGPSSPGATRRVAEVEGMTETGPEAGEELTKEAEGGEDEPTGGASEYGAQGVGRGSPPVRLVMLSVRLG